MANATSSGALLDVSTTLETFHTDLNNILNGLQTQVNTDATTESSALTTFITTEEQLKAASTTFGGPSPSFIAPIWIIPGSKKTKDSNSNKPHAKNYYTAFYPLIKRTLQIQTAKQMEAAEALKMLKAELESIFRAQFYAKFGVQSDATAAPANLATKSNYLEWVQDSVLLAGSNVNLTYQEEIINALGNHLLTNGISKITTPLNFTNSWAWAIAIITAATKTPGVDYDKKTRKNSYFIAFYMGKISA